MLRSIEQFVTERSQRPGHQVSPVLVVWRPVPGRSRYVYAGTQDGSLDSGRRTGCLCQEATLKYSDLIPPNPPSWTGLILNRAVLWSYLVTLLSKVEMDAPDRLLPADGSSCPHWRNQSIRHASNITFARAMTIILCRSTNGTDGHVGLISPQDLVLLFRLFRRLHPFCQQSVLPAPIASGALQRNALQVIDFVGVDARSEQGWLCLADS